MFLYFRLYNSRRGRGLTARSEKYSNGYLRQRMA